MSGTFTKKAVIKPVREKFDAWRRDPLMFVREQLGVEDPDLWQADACQAIVTNDRLALQAAKGPGKTAWMSWMMWWFLTVYPDSKVAATAISGKQLRDNLWAELAKWQSRSALLSAQFTWTGERITCNARPRNWFATARTWPADADPTSQAETLAGLHGDHILFVLDESGGIPEGVLATAEAGLANAISKNKVAKIIQAGNPTQESGALYHSVEKQKGMWWVKEITGDPLDPNRSKRIDVGWAQQLIDLYGRDHPYVRINVLGKFPLSASNAMCEREHVKAAVNRFLNVEDYSYAPIVLGIDVAAGGADRTVLFPRQGRLAFPPVIMRTNDTMDVGVKALKMAQDMGIKHVFVDANGWGKSLSDWLSRFSHTFTVTGVMSQGKATEAIYLNKRCEMWATMRAWFKDSEPHLPETDGLVDEISAPTYWYRKSDGKMQLEGKEELKDRGVPSPDLADALAFTFALPVYAEPKTAEEALAMKILANRGGAAITEVSDPDAWQRERYGS